VDKFLYDLALSSIESPAFCDGCPFLKNQGIKDYCEKFDIPIFSKQPCCWSSTWSEMLKEELDKLIGEKQ